ncbi:uncharacterized protein RCC_06239 [Ramularia collo-cygni]|uniref:Uncharacterized protein n=1 Tax=Ramularia collo-cygni TaxID=112498 RepID=A0A2D3VF36_9PEZI|nr:uncharacterized protein RCC_06239 [Ramularia collo-cygni]CZT20379.1 uncharacterized protein RCC_06239 [Ramularia collo-cygni]
MTDSTPSSPSLSHLLSLPSSTRTPILHSALTSYPTLTPPNLTPLDQIRYTTIPTHLQTHSHLSKPQLLQLLHWKLSHGKFRPTLQKLIDSNSPQVIEETTRRALAEFSKDENSPKTALNILTELKGIGPATASLILACKDPEGTVFFGDEVALWVLGNGDWKRKLKYSLKEYLEVYERVREVKEVLGLSAVEVEKVAFVFGKRAKGAVGESRMGVKSKVEDVVDVADGAEEVGGKSSKRKVEKIGVAEKPASKKKAKVEGISPPPPSSAAGTRRSTRSSKKS